VNALAYRTGAKRISDNSAYQKFGFRELVLSAIR
jgi:hypothetical protein